MANSGGSECPFVAHTDRSSADSGIRHNCDDPWHTHNRLMAKLPIDDPLTDPLAWARRCRIEAARAIHPATKAFLLELASRYETVAGETADLDPDDPELQSAVAERLAQMAADMKEWMSKGDRPPPDHSTQSDA